MFETIKRSYDWIRHSVLIQCVPGKGFGSACCETVHTIYISITLYTPPADPNPFRGTHCSNTECLACHEYGLLL